MKRSVRCNVAFMVNSSPGPGFRSEPSVTLPDAKAALGQVISLSRRGMRLIRIRDTDTGEVFDERGLRQHIQQLGTG